MSTDTAPTDAVVAPTLISSDLIPPSTVSPALAPLALAANVLVFSAAFVLIGQITAPAAQSSEPPLAAALQWLCSIGVLVGFVLALACVWTDRRGAPRRSWAAVLVALVLIFGLGVAWSMLQSQAMHALYASHGAQPLLAWTAGLAALKVVTISAVVLPIAWRLGGRGVTPVQWRGWHRRVIGALVGSMLCAGVSLLLQNVAAAYTSLGHGEQRIGMSVVALGVGGLLGLLWLAGPVRRGSGAMPALLSALLTPVLIVAASLALLAMDHNGWEMATLIAVVLLILLFAPIASWLIVRRLHGRGARA